MAKNGITVILTKEEKAEIIKKIGTFLTIRQFCKANRMDVPLLAYPLDKGRCSQRTYKKLINAKDKEQYDAMQAK